VPFLADVAFGTTGVAALALGRAALALPAPALATRRSLIASGDALERAIATLAFTACIRLLPADAMVANSTWRAITCGIDRNGGAEH